MKRFTAYLHTLPAIIAAAITTLTATGGTASATPPADPGAIAGSWVRHPAFHRQAERIIPAGERTYLHLHQHRHIDAGSSVDSINRSTIFFVDHPKEVEGDSAEMKALAAVWPQLPVAVRYASYNPVQRYLAMACENGELWILPDNGTPYRIAGTEQTHRPGRKRVKSLTFDTEGNKIWIATEFGYMTADPERRILTDVRSTETPLDWIADVEGNIVAIADETAWSVTPDSGNATATLSPLPIAASSAPEHVVKGGKLTDPRVIMPLTGRTFAFFGPRRDGTTGKSVCSATLLDGKWHIMQIGDDEFRQTTANESLNSTVYSLAVPNRDGYYLAANNFGYQLMRGSEPDLENDNPLSTLNAKLLKRRNKVAENWRISGSWDLDRFTFFFPFQGVYSRDNHDDAWGNRSPYFTFNGPAAPLSPYMTYHPDYGLVTLNASNSYIIPATTMRIPLLISALKENRWHDLSPLTNSTDPEVTKNYEGTPGAYFPIVDPDGIAIDPNNQALAFSGSLISGWARYNLAEPSETPVHAGSPLDYCRSNNTFYEVYPTPKSWNRACPISAPSFDAEGNLWMLYNDMDAKASEEGYPAYINYYTAADLKDMRNAHTDASTFREPRVLTVNLTDEVTNYRKFLALSHESNRHLIVIAPGGFQDPLFILDHNGTPDDPADDRMARLDMLSDPAGRNVMHNNITALWEDQSTGELWVGSDNGPFMVRPSECFDHPGRAYRPGAMSEGERGSMALLQSLQVNAFCTDPTGRMWLGTDRAGLLALTPGRDRIAAHITEEMSPLPSDRVYGLCWNPERNAVMVSTDQGLAEFFPADITAGGAHGSVKAIPGILTPTHSGAVTFTGLRAGLEVEITDAEGNIAASGVVHPDGVWQWEARDGEGRRVRPGKYILTASGSDEELAEVSVI